MAERTGDDPQETAREIARLQALRVRRPRETAIGPMVESILKKSESASRRQGQFIDLWQEEVAPEIVEQTAIDGYRAGVLHVRVSSSAVAFDLDRQLRSGLLARLRSRFAGTLTRVKITVGLSD